MVDRIGQQLGNYRLVRSLGRGGAANVYLGEHLYLKSQAAIKVLHSILSEKEQGDFLLEAQRLAGLKHPHIIRILDFAVEDDVPFLVMEYAPHGTMRTHQPKGSRLPIETIISYVKQATDALQYIHEQKLVHRDIKPENMLLGANHNLLLSDFGIAAAAHTTGSLIVQNQAGTPAYMAPEQILRMPRPASDQYALGMVVYEWLCGKRPFDELEGSSILHHLHTPPPPLREQLPAISPAIENVVLKALAKNPKERFASIQAFAAAFAQAHQEGERTSSIFRPSPSSPATFPASPPLSGPLSPSNTDASSPRLATQVMEEAHIPNREGKPQRIPTLAHQGVQHESVPLLSQKRKTFHGRVSRRTVVAGLSLAGFALVGGGMSWFVVSHPVPPHASATPTPTPLVGKTLYTRFTTPDDIAWSPNSKRIASATGLTVQVWDAADGSHVYTYTGHTRAVAAVAWSPDGKRIASTGDDMTVQVWNAADGSHVFTHKGPTDSSYTTGLAWSPDGKRIASAVSGEDLVQVWDATNGGHLFTYMGHAATVNPEPVYSVAWSPNGKYIVSAGPRTVQVWGATSGDSIPTQGFTPPRLSPSNQTGGTLGESILTYQGSISAARGTHCIAWSPDSTRIAIAGDNDIAQVLEITAHGEPVYTYTGHVKPVLSVAWSPDGQYIASASDDMTVQIWEAADGSHVYTYKHHSGAVRLVAWSPDGQYIASASDAVQIWTDV